ncbi:hypothetical protein GIB67_031203 [Kingdonia uniflora]|uniref:Pentatricopeptide repeat-containing protein n=1 Tax=Kingdonia uniflora TaxID=39325 RepID=A0A7J7NKS6_9MAGN|nr:hypothetical protein GIB67_031203 [Kingdonia uniflora]
MGLYNANNHQLLLPYTKLLASHVNQACHEQALSLFHHIHTTLSLILDPFVFPLALKCCAALRRPRLGTTIHAYTTKAFHNNAFIACALVDMYGKCVSVSSARNLFDEIPQRNVVVWNSMISLYCKHNDVSAARGLFESMNVAPNPSSFNCILAALCESSGAENGGCYEAIGFYRGMQVLGVRPNLITVLALLPVCVGVVALNLIKELHGYSIRNNIGWSRPHLSSGLVEAYGRCGCLGNARRIFDRMSEKDVVAWSSMVSVYALHGEVETALSLFQQMELARVRPDAITFLGVLKACSHAGLADEAQMYFRKMQSYYKVKASSDHYACLVDVLSRAGRLYEAYKVLREMPVKATAKAWGALLAACRSYGEMELAEVAGRVLFEIEPNNAGNYVLLASIYSAAGRFKEAERVRTEMKDRGVKSLPGSSWVIDHD